MRYAFRVRFLAYAQSLFLINHRAVKFAVTQCSWYFPVFIGRKTRTIFRLMVNMRYAFRVRFLAYAQSLFLIKHRAAKFAVTQCSWHFLVFVGRKIRTIFRRMVNMRYASRICFLTISQN